MTKALKVLRDRHSNFMQTGLANLDAIAANIPCRPIYLALFTAALMIVATPGLTTAMPPLLDYPNHFARIWMLAEGHRHSPASAMYAPDFQLAWTNIGIDLAAYLLGPIVPAWLLGRIFVALALVLPPAGAAALHRRLHGPGRWWPIGFAAAAWSSTMIGGFLNFQIGIGLALFALAGNLSMRLPSPWKFILSATASVILLIIHPFAMGFYAAGAAALALGSDLSALKTGSGWRAAALRISMSVAPPVLVLVLFGVIAPSRPEGPIVFGAWTWSSRLYILRHAIGAYDIQADQMLMGLLAGLVVLAAFIGRVRVHVGLLIAGGAFIIFALVGPGAAAGSWWVNLRMPIMALLLLLVAVDPQYEARRGAEMAAALACLAIVIGRTAPIAAIWHDRQSDVTALARALEAAPPGVAILPLVQDPPATKGLREPAGRWAFAGPTVWHLPSLAVPLRGDFVPTVFATAGQQPLAVQPAWRNTAFPGHPPASIHALDGHGGGPWKIVAGYAACWRTHFDYALVINADLPDKDGPLRPPPGLKLIADEGFARLYKIDRTTPAGPNPALCPPPPP